MRVYGPTDTATTTPIPVARRIASEVFDLSEQAGAPAPASGTGPRAIRGIEALLALQGVEEPLERRRRAVTRGRTALDVLDELKLGLLAGILDQAVLSRLKSAASGLKNVAGDPDLDGVLAEIELRVEVELAKMDPAAGA
jgi:hypothetical protein